MLEPSSSATRLPRGRPPAHATSDLRASALRIFQQNGYTNTTMKQLADALGVSLRTLHRNFPSKTDIVWSPLEESIDQLRRRLRSKPADMSVHTAMQEAIIEVISTWSNEHDTAYGWLEIVGRAPELRSAQSAALDSWRRDLREFAASRLGLDPDSVEVAGLAAGVQSATIEAISWWSRHPEDGSLADAIRRAVQALRLSHD